MGISSDGIIVYGFDIGEDLSSISIFDEESDIDSFEDFLLKEANFPEWDENVSDDYFEKKKIKGLAGISADPSWIEKMIQERKDARKTKNWARADQIRKQLEEMNIILEDRPDGTFWKINN